MDKNGMFTTETLTGLSKLLNHCVSIAFIAIALFCLCFVCFRPGLQPPANDVLTHQMVLTHNHIYGDIERP
jgi:hypothetical protein